MTEEKLKEVKGEHPYGDLGQLILLVLFLVVWVLDSFFLRVSTVSSTWVPLYIRLIFMGLCFIVSGYLLRSGHVVVEGGQRPLDVVSEGAFKFVRHPIYLASMIVYFALVVATASLVSLVLSLVNGTLAANMRM